MVISVLDICAQLSLPIAFWITTPNHALLRNLGYTALTYTLSMTFSAICLI
jgi:hypothetical protein